MNKIKVSIAILALTILSLVACNSQSNIAVPTSITTTSTTDLAAISTQPAYPYPMRQGTKVVSSAQATPTLPTIDRPFFDCSIYPGITDCSALPGIQMHGSITIRDRWTGLVYTLDLETGLAKTSRQGEATNIEPVSSRELTSPEGDRAWLEQRESTWTLHVKGSASDSELRIWELEPETTDRIHALIDWIPRTPLLLAVYYYGNNDSVFYGGFLYKFDTNSGEKTDLPGRLVLSKTLISKYEWHPYQDGVLAFASAGLTPTILNVITGEKDVLTPESVIGAYPTWSSDGRFIAFSAATYYSFGDNAPDFPPAIYIFNTETKEIIPITFPKAGIIDYWPQWSIDNTYLLYLRHYREQDYFEIRIVSFDHQVDVPIVTGLFSPKCFSNFYDCNWEEYFTYSP